MPDRREMLKALAALPGAVLVDRSGKITAQAVETSPRVFVVFVDERVFDADNLGEALGQVLPRESDALVVPVRPIEGQSVADAVAIYSLDDRT